MNPYFAIALFFVVVLLVMGWEFTLMVALIAIALFVVAVNSSEPNTPCRKYDPDGD